MSDDENLSEDERAEILQRDGLMLGVVLFSVANGMHFSPWLDYIFLPVKILMSSLFGGMDILVFYVSSLLLTTGTFVLSGVPAALFERVTGKKRSENRTLMIWLVCAAILALPSFLRLGGLV